MFKIKLLVSILLITTFDCLKTCEGESIKNQLIISNKSDIPVNEFEELIAENVTESRTGRAIFPHPKSPAFSLRRRQPIKIRSRADHLPLRTQIRRVYNSLPNNLAQQQNLRFGYDSLKNSKYIKNSKGTNTGSLNNGKGAVQRPQLLAVNSNTVSVPALSQQYIHNFKASPAFNGQVVVHPVTQKQQITNLLLDNAYAKYVKPQQQTSTATVKQSQQPQPQPALTPYPEFKQYPIPDQEKMQKFNEQHEKYLQQQKYLTPTNPIAYYQLQKQQKELQAQKQQHQSQMEQNYAVQQPSIPIHENSQKINNNNVAFPAAAAVPPKMYSVYEENDMTELQNNNYQTVNYHGLNKEAQEYLRFMNTNDYFLPKKDPNYKKIDEETDKHQYNVLNTQAQQHLYSLQNSQSPTAIHNSLSSAQQPYQQLQQLTQNIYTPSSSTSSEQITQYSNSIFADLSDPGSYNPDLSTFYQKEPAAAASSTVVRTSYQTGFNQNQIHINSKDNRVSKYSSPIASTPNTIVLSTQSPMVYSKLKHNFSASNRTPEPLRFEFTERDAMVGGVTYTHAPQEHLGYNNGLASNAPVTSSVESSTVSSLASKYDSTSLRTKNYVGSTHETKTILDDTGDDPEDGDDMQEGNNLYGRQPVVKSDSKNSISTTMAPPIEQKDTEEYCERICAIVEDENEEIVCGSDGYMYTSEAQMECYASCLHIDVTIQGKGSCSTR